MHRRRRRAAGVLIAAVALGATMAPGAAAHITVQPSASRPAGSALPRHRAHERNASTTGVDLQLPAGVTFALVEQAAGWRTKVIKQGSAISQLQWRGGPVPPGGYAELRFIARNPVKTGPVTWKTLQRYDDGTVVRWIGGADSETPAAVTTLSEDAVPIDVVSTHGEDTVQASRSQPAGAAAASAASGDDRDPWTLGLAILAVVLAGTALALQLTRARRNTH